MQAKRFLLILAPLATSTAAGAAPESATPPTPAPAASAGSEVAQGVTELTLEQALSRMEAQNLDLAVARVRAEQAAAMTRQAGAGLRPTLTATGSYVRNNEEVALNIGSLLSQLPGAPNVDNVVIQPLDAWSAAGTLRIPLFVPTAWHDVNTAQAAEDVAKNATELARKQGRAALAQLAYGALALEEVVAASERAIELADQQKQSAERRVQAGTAAPLDVLRAEAERVRREGDRARARADLDRLRLSIGVLLGEARMVRITVPPEVLAPRADVSAAAAFERRPEIAMSDAEARVGESMVDSSKSRFWPQLHATGSVFASDEPYPTGENTGWRVAVELTVPLYDGGFRYGKRQEADARLELARTQAAQKRLQIRQEIADAEREVGVASERLRLAETRVMLARDAAASAQRSFVVGLSTSLDVLDANDKLFQAEVALAAEKARKAQARVELERALGTL